MTTLQEINKSAKKEKTNMLSNNINLDNFKGKTIITYGTFDIFHEGHRKIIKHCIEITGKQENVIVAVASDDYNKFKNKKSLNNENKRVADIRNEFPNVKIILEENKFVTKNLPNHLEENKIDYFLFSTWTRDFDHHNVDLIIMGGDHFFNLDYLNGIETISGRKLKIAFFERTPNISSTKLREIVGFQNIEKK